MRSIQDTGRDPRRKLENLEMRENAIDKFPSFGAEASSGGEPWGRSSLLMGTKGGLSKGNGGFFSPGVFIGRQSRIHRVAPGRRDLFDGAPSRLLRVLPFPWSCLGIGYGRRSYHWVARADGFLKWASLGHPGAVGQFRKGPAILFFFNERLLPFFLAEIAPRSLPGQPDQSVQIEVPDPYPAVRTRRDQPLVGRKRQGGNRALMTTENDRRGLRIH